MIRLHLFDLIVFVYWFTCMVESIIEGHYLSAVLLAVALVWLTERRRAT